MSVEAPPPDPLRRLEASLYRQLLVMAAVCGSAGFLFGGLPWAIGAGVGPLVAIVYYAMLAAQTRRLFAFGRNPGVPLLLVGVVTRQVLCVAVPILCYFWLGQPWLACLATLFVGRHWIVVPASRAAT